MSLPPSSAPTATGWSDSCRAGFAPAEEWRLSRRTRIPRLSDPRANTAAARVEGERAPTGRRALVGPRIRTHGRARQDPRELRPAGESRGAEFRPRGTAGAEGVLGTELRPAGRAEHLRPHRPVRRFATGAGTVAAACFGSRVPGEPDGTRHGARCRSRCSAATSAPWMAPSYDPELNLVYVGTSRHAAPAPKIMLGGTSTADPPVPVSTRRSRPARRVPARSSGWTRHDSGNAQYSRGFFGLAVRPLTHSHTRIVRRRYGMQRHATAWAASRGARGRYRGRPALHGTAPPRPCKRRGLFDFHRSDRQQVIVASSSVRSGTRRRRRSTRGPRPVRSRGGSPAPRRRRWQRRCRRRRPAEPIPADTAGPSLMVAPLRN